MRSAGLIVGAAGDSAQLKGGHDAIPAMRRIADARATFVSRGDRSGTHLLEQKLWRIAGIRPPASGAWYIESGQGMAATLQMADQKRAYTISDRATYLAWRDKLQLVPLVEGDTLLYNVYHVMEKPPAGPGAKTLADFLGSPAAQALCGWLG